MVKFALICGNAMHCAFCGVPLSAYDVKRYPYPDEVAEFVDKYVKQGLVVYETLRLRNQSSMQTCMCVCAACSNWMRRVTRKACGRFMFVLDCLVEWALEPGCVKIPDRRCLQRIVGTLQRKANIYHTVIPEPAQRILLEWTHGVPVNMSIPREYEQYITNVVFAWWEYNNKPVFLRNKQCAKFVRRALRDKEKQLKL